MDEFLILLQAKLDEAKSKGNLNEDIGRIQDQLNELKLQAEIDPKTISHLTKQLEGILNQKIVISDIGIQPNQTVKEARKTGQQIGQVISESAEKAIRNVSSKGIGKYFKVSSSGSQQFQAEMEKLVDEWTNGKGKVTDINIQTRTSFDEDLGKNMERLHQATVTYKNELDEVIKKTIAWRQIGTTIGADGEEEILRGFVEVAGQYSKSMETATMKTDQFAKKQRETVANIKNTIHQITARAFDSNFSRPITSKTSLEQLNTQVAYVENAFYDLRNATADTFDDAKLKVQEEITALKILERELRNADNVSTKLKGTDVISGFAIAQNDLEKLKADAKDYPQIIQTIQNLDAALSQVGDAASLNSFNDQLRIARSELSKIKSETSAINRSKKVEINISGLQSKIANLQRISPEIDQFKTEIGGAELSVESLLSDLQQVNTSGDFSVVNSKFRAFTSAAKSAGIATSEFGSIMQSQFKQIKNTILQTFSIGSAFALAFSKTKQSISELKEVNTLLTEISKANDQLTKSDLARIGNDSFEIASKYGKTATDYLSGVQEASRAGYQNAEKMAELSVAAQGAGDMTAELANQYIIATDKAYQLNGSVEKLMEVLDGSNTITNNNAVNMTELAEGMSIVGSQAASLGIEANETTAILGTMIATTQQSGSEMARAFKAILLNLQQVTDEEEGIDAESLTKYEEACKALNVSLKETKNGVTSLRKPMEVIKDLAEEYSQLDTNDIRRSNLLSSVGGKLRANALNAILENYDMYEKMLQEYASGTGSMAKEAEKTANSWEGSLNRLSNTWTDTVENIAKSDAILFIINKFETLLSYGNKFTDWLGSLGTIGVGAGLFAGLKNVGMAE